MTHFAHDRIVHLGGAEAVLADLIRKYGDKDSHIFVMYSDKEYFEVDGEHYPIITALPKWINKLFQKKETENKKQVIRNWLFDYRNLMPFYPLLCWILRRKIEQEIRNKKQEASNQIIISSFAAVKNIVPCGNSGFLLPVTCYLHSPMQYIRENYSEYTHKLTGVKKWIFVLVSKYLKPWDKAARYYNHIIYNSHYTKSVAENIYPFLTDDKRQPTTATISYPTINPLFFTQNVAKEHEILDYFVYVGRLVNFIRETDTIIQLANALEFKLLVLGDGPDAAKLKASAGSSITFLGNISDVQTKIDIIKKSKGLVNLAKESCGLATIEALLLGVPVFGYNAGGTKELVDNQSGLLVKNKNLEELMDAFESFQSRNWERISIQENMRKKLI